MNTITLRPLVAQGAASFASLFGTRADEVGELLVELIVGLSSLQEEGFAYAPLVFVTPDHEAMLAELQGSDPILVGRSASPLSSARSALKHCAPLGEGRRWAVFVRISPDGFDYGLFRPQGSPLRPTSFELLRRARNALVPAVGIARLRNGVVEVRSSDGAGSFFDLSGNAEETTSPGSAINTFVAAVTSTVPEELRPQLEAFYYRIGVEVLTGGHGALAAVLAPGVEAPAFLSDGIWFPDPVDILKWIQRDDRGATGEGAHAMLAYAQLIRRMLGMDGITVFGSDGSVRAYSCFIHEPRITADQTFLIGGARRRAFGYLKSQLGRTLSCALYKSQDGAVECVANTPARR